MMRMQPFTLTLTLQHFNTYFTTLMTMLNSGMIPPSTGFYSGKQGHILRYRRGRIKAGMVIASSAAK